MWINLISLVFIFLRQFGGNNDLFAKIVAGGEDVFNTVKEGLASNADPTLEDLYTKLSELRPPVNLQPTGNGE